MLKRKEFVCGVIILGYEEMLDNYYCRKIRKPEPGDKVRLVQTDADLALIRYLILLCVRKKKVGLTKRHITPKQT